VAAVTRAPIRVAIVDDEPLARASLRVLLARDPEIAVVGDAIGVDAPALIERERVELLFLDVEMPELDGFGVLAALDPKTLPVTVFVTAHDRYALRAFEVHAIDYVLKPLDEIRLATTLTRAKQRLADAGASERLATFVGEHERNAKRILVRSRGKVAVIRIDDVDWIEATDYYATVHVDRATHLVRQSLAELEATLDARTFVRVHRGAIVNIDRVREVRSLLHGDSELVLRDGTLIRLSRTRRAEFEKRFGKLR
jgi:two-component system, LytTR family, response regulator